MFSKPLLAQAARLLEICKTRRIMLTTAESCTGGLIAGLLTEIPGSSAVVERGFVTYSDNAKHELLGVKKATLKRYGAVSKETAKEMALGALKYSHARLAIAVTGIAGPGGGSVEKPAGLVYVAVILGKKAVVKECHFKGTRNAIRLAAIHEALAMATAQSDRSA